MKSKYSIGFLSCCACLIIAMTFAYQFSYQKAKARAEKLKIEEQQTMENDTLLCISAIRKHLMSIQTFIMMNFQNF